MKNSESAEMEFIKLLQSFRNQNAEYFSATRCLESDFKSVSMSFEEIKTRHSLRQSLIELQCNMDIGLPIVVHEKYHEVYESLIHSLKTYFGQTKTFLNTITKFIGDVLPQESVKGINTNSFGNFIHNFLKKKPTNKSLLQLQEICQDEGQYLLHTSVFYRNKYIEHISSFEQGDLQTSPDGSVSLHYGKKIFRNDDLLSEEESGASDRAYSISDPYIDRYLIDYENDRDVVFLHIKPYRMHLPGEVVHAGESIGYMYDNTKTHFDRFGRHAHVFDGENNTYNWSAKNYSAQYKYSSPDIEISMSKLCDFSSKVINVLMDFVNR